MQQLTIGTLLQGGKYKIEKILGQGSFGITYLAEHTILGKKVAIKEFFMKELNSRAEDGSITGMSDSSLSYNYCQKFKKEAINLSRLDHPNIVRVTDSFAENGTFYYAMDYINGQNLNDYIKSRHIEENEAVTIIKSVADALTYMHEKHHMLHLDLKPGNVMRRNSDGHIFLIDFGLSKHYDKNGQPDTSTTIGLGTAGYAPIEQANQAKNGEFRPTIDVYALGATLYKLLTRETPPDASMLVSDEDLIEKNLREKDISEKLIGVIAASMQPSVKKRLQTVEEFKMALENDVKEEETIVTAVAEETIAPTVDTASNIPEETKFEQEDNETLETAEMPEEKNLDSGKSLTIFIAIVVFVVGLLLLIPKGQKTANTSNYIGCDSDSVLVDYGEAADTSACFMTINGNECQYIGDVSYDNNGNPIANGSGEADFDNGSYYKGPFSNGKMHGSSAYFRFANNDEFEGSFVNNHFSDGTYTVKETGEQFVGTFDSQGQPKSGTWFDKNGNVLENV